MPITFPRSLPSTYIRSHLFGSDQAVAVSRSPFSYSDHVQHWGGERWAGVIEIPRLTRANADAWHAWILSLRGSEGTFLAGDELRSSPRGSVPGTPVVSGELAAGNQIATTGWTPSQTGVLLAGDMIQIGVADLARLYMVIEDADSDGSGDATLTVWPNVRNPTSGLTQAEKTTDGGLETWASASDLTNWTEAAGSGTIAQETTTFRSGANAAKFTTAASGYQSISQALAIGTFTAGYHYRVRDYWAKDAAVAATTRQSYGILEQSGTPTTARYRWDYTTKVWQRRSDYGGASFRSAAMASSGTWYASTEYVPMPARIGADALAVNLFSGFSGAGAGEVFYADDVSVYGPTTDGLPIVTSSPVGVFRLSAQAFRWLERTVIFEGMQLPIEEVIRA